MTSLPSTTLLRLLLVDADPVFRLGMGVWLNQYPDVSLVAAAADGERALQILAGRLEPLEPEIVSSERRSERRIDLVLLDLSIGQASPGQIQGLNLCRLIRARYPDLPILCLSNATEPVIRAAAQQSGASGYCARDLAPDDFVAVMRQVAAGQPYWHQTSRPELSQISRDQVSRVSRVSRGTDASGSRTSAAFSDPVSERDLRPTPAPLATFRRQLKRSGLQQIEAALAEVHQELQDLDLSLLDRAVLAGRQRELRAARWLVRRLLATPALERSEISNQRLPIGIPTDATRQINPDGQVGAARLDAARLDAARQPTIGTDRQTETIGSGVLQPQQTQGQIQTLPELSLTQNLQDLRGLQSLAFDTLLGKLQTGLVNQTEAPLEIDILCDDKKRELVYLVVRKLEELLSELRYSQVEPAQLPLKRAPILLDLWQAVLVDFLGKYYTVRLGETEVEVIEVLLRDAPLVQTEILDKIPGVTELLQHFLFQTPLLVDAALCPPGNPAALLRVELLLENLTLQVANAVIQPLLNHFANVETIKQTFYDQRLLSNREVERFRNDLSWHYRLVRLYREPKQIFESQYKLLILTERAIKQTYIYAPRTAELDQLTGLPYLVTLALETRDAVSPRLRSVVSFVGNGFVYVLTEVIGRGIGLIGKGVLKGLGNVWQDTKSGRR
jgi:DNA-binding NarL/FixJ family response regulator